MSQGLLLMPTPETQAYRVVEALFAASVEDACAGSGGAGQSMILYVKKQQAEMHGAALQVNTLPSVSAFKHFTFGIDGLPATEERFWRNAAFFDAEALTLRRGELIRSGITAMRYVDRAGYQVIEVTNLVACGALGYVRVLSVDDWLPPNRSQRRGW